jgi:enoyl-CoA hydratase
MSLATRRVGGACWRTVSAVAVCRQGRIQCTRARTFSVVIENDSSVNTTWLRLNAPASRNALSADMVEALIDGLDAAAHHSSSLLVLAAEGVTFSGGFDLSGLGTQTDADLLRRFVRVEQFLQHLNHLPMTTVALVQGRCVGAAADAVACCRHRVASPDATFRFPGLRFGLVLGTRRCV